MSKTISLDELSPKLERLLQSAWDEHESVLLERNGEPVAAVVSLDEYRRLQAEIMKTEHRGHNAEAAEVSLACEIPAEILAAYHRLISKQLAEGLTADEKIELARIEQQLDEAELATPLGRFITIGAEREHTRRMAILDELIAKLKTLQAS